MFKAALFGALMAAGLPAAVIAQDSSLADIRTQLSTLYIDIQGLRSELTASGQLTQGTVGNTPLERLNSIESELQRLTAKTEQLENRINRITTDGTNRVGDLEFRLCELEEGCDVAALGDTPSLGGVDSAAQIPTAAPPPAAGTPSLAIGEGADFERAQAALASGDFRGAADQLATFSTSYPGSPLGQQAHYLRGQAFEGLGDMTNAARAYLDAFSGNPTGTVAPDALFKLGSALGSIGQTQDACITLTEVGTRFPGNPAVLEAESAKRNLGCQ